MWYWNPSGKDVLFDCWLIALYRVDKADCITFRLMRLGLNKANLMKFDCPARLIGLSRSSFSFTALMALIMLHSNRSEAGRMKVIEIDRTVGSMRPLWTDVYSAYRCI